MCQFEYDHRHHYVAVYYWLKAIELGHPFSWFMASLVSRNLKSFQVVVDRITNKGGVGVPVEMPKRVSTVGATIEGIIEWNKQRRSTSSARWTIHFRADPRTKPERLATRLFLRARSTGMNIGGKSKQRMKRGRSSFLLPFRIHSIISRPCVFLLLAVSSDRPKIVVDVKVSTMDLKTRLRRFVYSSAAMHAIESLLVRWNPDHSQCVVQAPSVSGLSCWLTPLVQNASRGTAHVTLDIGDVLYNVHQEFTMTCSGSQEQYCALSKRLLFGVLHLPECNEYFVTKISVTSLGEREVEMDAAMFIQRRWKGRSIRRRLGPRIVFASACLKEIAAEYQKRYREWMSNCTSSLMEFQEAHRIAFEVERDEQRLELLRSEYSERSVLLVRFIERLELTETTGRDLMKREELFHWCLTLKEHEGAAQYYNPWSQELRNIHRTFDVVTKEAFQRRRHVAEQYATFSQLREMLLLRLVEQLKRVCSFGEESWARKEGRKKTAFHHEGGGAHTRKPMSLEQVLKFVR